MLNFSPEKLLMIGILALLVLGPNRLPAAARTAGRVLGELRKLSGALQSELRDTLAEPRQALQHAADEFGLDGLRSSVRDMRTTLTDTTPQPSSPAVTPAHLAVPAGDPPAPDDPALN